MRESPGHLIVYRASRLEALVGPLQGLIRQSGPEDPLAPVRIVTGHAGMRPWLVRRLAAGAGLGGIVANLDIQLPSGFLERLAQRTLGESAVALAPYRREHLRWRVFEALPRLAQPTVAAYLQGSDAARRRFQLADHLAGLLSQYIVYRSDWLQAWAAGRSVLAADRDSPLPPLWRMLRADIGLPHRGERLQQLVDALALGAPDADSSALHLFGISHLAPSELAVFAALARHRPVVLYLPDPCREHWMGLQAPRAQLRARLDAGDLDDAGVARLFLDQGHPLLAAWGRLGQEFLLELDRHDTLSDVRDGNEAAELDQAPGNRLQRLQASIRRLDTGLLSAAPERGDASLRVHACHTRLRELEVLRDALYEALGSIEGLQPADIVVMAPDIAAYQPLLPAVFGEPGDPRVPLPWHMADAPLLRSHPLLAAFARVLALPASRLPVEEVLDLLRVPAIAARLRLDAGAAARIGGWLQQAGVAWALDAGHRAQFDVPAIAPHTFAWGMDRLLAAHVFGDVGGRAVPLDAQAIVPAAAAVEGPQAGDLGALDVLLRTLQDWRESARKPRPASAWARALGRLVEALFFVPQADAAAREALDVLRGLVAQLAEQPQQAGHDPQLEYAVVAEMLGAQLQAVPQRQPFLLGGMTVCGMVPQRAIPFRVVAVLGLDDGQFPRSGGDGGLDLMARQRRLGDRDVRSDDRWLFLETVMAARDRLHLSWIGSGVRDGKPRNPAPPLAELMTLLQRHEPASCRAQDGGERHDLSWLVRHPLQPFDAAYTDGSDPALFTHIQAHAAPRATGRPVAPFADLEAAVRAHDPGAPLPPSIELDAVLRWYRDPARQLLRDVLGLRLDMLRAPQQGEEPLDARPSPILRLERRLLREAIDARQDQTAVIPPPQWRLDGSLPPGSMGDAAWQSLRAGVDPLLQRLRGIELFGGGWPPALLQPAQFMLDGCSIRGPAPDAVGDAGHVLVPVWAIGKKENQAGLQHSVPAFIQWALLRLSPQLADARVELLWLGDGRSKWCEGWNAHALDADDLRARLRALLGWFATAQRTPLPYFPRTCANAMGDGDKAAAEWIRERGYGMGEAALLAGQRRFEWGDADLLALKAVAEQVTRTVQLPGAGEVA